MSSSRFLTHSPHHTTPTTCSTTDTVYPWDEAPTFRWWGKVYILLGQKGRGLPTSLEDKSVVEVWTNRTFTGLGEVLAAGDIDADGHPDLLMGCPIASGAAGVSNTPVVLLPGCRFPPDLFTRSCRCYASPLGNNRVGCVLVVSRLLLIQTWLCCPLLIYHRLLVRVRRRSPGTSTR